MNRVPGKRRQTPRRKRGYHHGDLRRALLGAALDLLARKGPAALSLREVARRVGVSHAAPYRHFADRDALVAAVAQEGFEELARAMGAAVSGPAAPLDRMRAMGHAYVRFALERPAHFRVMFSMDADAREAYPALARAADNTYDRLLAEVRAGQRAGIVRDTDPEALADTVWAAVHGLAVLLLDGQLRRPETEPETRIDPMLDNLRMGLLA
ncbi:MAG TPA: TetR/AcrR family transcriptional regulator [Gammaproteobacteria bacterium]|nr:TetR/AcrR family transcriptional regulator [Gammaproteobacteria bacterium]